MSSAPAPAAGLDMTLDVHFRGKKKSEVDRLGSQDAKQGSHGASHGEPCFFMMFYGKYQGDPMISYVLQVDCDLFKCWP